MSADIETLEVENRMLRARNERLEAELAEAQADRQIAIKAYRELLSTRPFNSPGYKSWTTTLFGIRMVFSNVEDADAFQQAMQARLDEVVQK